MSEEAEKRFERLYVGLGKQVVSMQEEIDRLNAENALLKAEKRLWVVEKESQARIIQQAINNMEARLQQQEITIQELRRVNAEASSKIQLMQQDINIFKAMGIGRGSTVR